MTAGNLRPARATSLNNRRTTRTGRGVHLRPRGAASSPPRTLPGRCRGRGRAGPGPSNDRLSGRQQEIGDDDGAQQRSREGILAALRLFFNPLSAEGGDEVPPPAREAWPSAPRARRGAVGPPPVSVSGGSGGDESPPAIKGAVIVALSDIEIAQRATLKRAVDVAAGLGIPEDQLEPYGHYKAKISLGYLESLKSRPAGKLILVTAISPTPAGEGKTTTTVGLGDALNRIGRRTIICLREPSLGPVFGMKGGAAGGGYAQIVPMEDINLHFTGDFNAIALANNLLAALIDNHIHHGNELQFDVRRIAWKRVMDMNDRALREITNSLGGPGNGYPRQDGFDIVVASEVMAIF